MTVSGLTITRTVRQLPCVVTTPTASGLPAPSAAVVAAPQQHMEMMVQREHLEVESRVG